MAIVNFATNKVLDQRVAMALKKRGFSSKAELFRMAVIYFLDTLEKPVGEEIKFHYLADQVSKEVTAKYSKKNLPSLRQQLADL